LHPRSATPRSTQRIDWPDVVEHRYRSLPPDVKPRIGERFRGWDFTGVRWRKIDQPALGWRARSVYDTRATFITLAIEESARRDILRDRVTHAKPKRDAFDGYDRGERCAETCREVAKLRIAIRVPEMYPATSSSENWSGSWGLHPPPLICKNSNTPR
jgi:hypothetical protein